MSPHGPPYMPKFDKIEDRERDLRMLLVLFSNSYYSTFYILYIVVKIYVISSSNILKHYT